MCVIMFVYIYIYIHMYRNDKGFLADRYRSSDILNWEFVARENRKLGCEVP